MKFLDLVGLKQVVTKLKARINTAKTEAVDTSKDYADEIVTDLIMRAENLIGNSYRNGYTQHGRFKAINLSNGRFFELGKTYSVSFDANVLIDKQYISLVTYYSTNGSSISGSTYLDLPVLSNNNRYSVTFKITNASVTHLLLYPQYRYAPSPPSESAGEVKFSNIAVYEGDKDLGFQPTEADRLADAKSVANAYTDSKTSSAINVSKAYTDTKFALTKNGYAYFTQFGAGVTQSLIVGHNVLGFQNLRLITQRGGAYFSANNNEVVYNGVVRTYEVMLVFSFKMSSSANLGFRLKHNYSAANEQFSYAQSNNDNQTVTFRTLITLGGHNEPFAMWVVSDAETRLTLGAYSLSFREV